MYNLTNIYNPSADKEVENGIFKTSINNVYFVQHAKHGDSRGFFSEIVRIAELEKVLGFDFKIKQINHARSEKNVSRGIHAEDWNKLVFVSSGLAFCAIVDVRPQSTTYGKKEYFVLGVGEQALNGAMFLPAGAGNSVSVLEGPIDYIYAVDKLYKERDPSGDVAISLFDPDIAIEWPIPKDEMIISDRDKNAVSLKQRFPEKS